MRREHPRKQQVPGLRPLLTLLGPMVIAQYALWRLRGRQERTVSDWRAGHAALYAR